VAFRLGDVHDADVAGATAIRALTRSVQALATRSATARVGFLIAANQEGGKIQGLAGSGFDTIPSALVQGSWSVATLRSRAERWGKELIAAGVDVNFAPVADVVPPGTDADNAPIGQLQREFGHDPTVVSTHVRAFIAGMTAAGVVTTAKHFPGLGRVAGNTDFTGDVVDDVTTPDDPYLAPFRAAVAAHVPFVMVSLATYERIDPDHLAVFSPTIIDGILRKDMGFRGVVTSDALGATRGGVHPGRDARRRFHLGRRGPDRRQPGPRRDRHGEGARRAGFSEPLVRRADRRFRPPHPPGEAARGPAAVLTPSGVDEPLTVRPYGRVDVAYEGDRCRRRPRCSVPSRCSRA
jgi:hypothetical protein